MKRVVVGGASIRINSSRTTKKTRRATIKRCSSRRSASILVSSTIDKQEYEHHVTVKELAEFVHRRGDLGGSGTFRRSNRAIEGIKGHRRYQLSRGADYKAEVPVEQTFVKSEVLLRVKGRADGVIADLSPMVEEIKTVEPRWSKQADPVHSAQCLTFSMRRVNPHGH
jgi:hypothetical protein